MAGTECGMRVVVRIPAAWPLCQRAVLEVGHNSCLAGEQSYRLLTSAESNVSAGRISSSHRQQRVSNFTHFQPR